MLDKFNLKQVSPAKTPCRSGLVIDRLPHNDVPIEQKQKLIKEYQSIMGCLNWLSINTRPDISTAFSLLSQFNSNPSDEHLKSAKYVLKYLSRGLWFKQGENRLQGTVAIPDHLKGTELLTFTDSNWGPQEASQPRENET